MSILLLSAAILLSLALIPLGLPGTWVMVAAGVAYSYLVPAGGIGAVAIIACVVIALGAELLEFTVLARYTRKYGGSRRGAWGAIAGGLVGAVVGVPVPIIGSVIGAIAGSFAGALVAEYTRGAGPGAAARSAAGAAVGRAVAMGLKAGAGCVIGALLIGAAMLS